MYSADLLCDRVDLGDVPGVEKALGGSVSGRMHVEGRGVTGKNIAAAASVSLSSGDLRIPGVSSPLEAACTFGGSIQGDRVKVDRLNVCLDDTRLEARGSYAVGARTVSANVTLDAADLAEILPLFGVDSLAGTVSLEADVRGRLPRPAIEGSLQGRGLGYAAFSIGDLTLDACLNDEGMVTVSGLYLRNRQSSLHLSGNAGLFAREGWLMRSTPEFDVVVADTRLYLQDFFDALAGEVALDARIRGTASAMAGTVSVSGGGLTLPGQNVHSLSLQADLDSKKIHVAPLRIALSPGEVVEARGWFSLDKDYRIALHADSVSLNSIDALKGAGALRGSLRIELGGEGRWDNPTLEGTCTVRNMRVDNRPVEDVILNLSLRDTVVSVDGKMNFDVAGTYHLGSKAFVVSAIFEGTELAPFFQLVNRPQLHGTISGSVEALGSLGDIGRTQAVCDIRELDVYHNDLSLVRGMNLLMRSEGEEIKVPPLKLTVLDRGTVTLAGEGNVGGDVDFRVDGVVPLAFVGMLVPDLPDIDGTVSVGARVQGSFKEPAVSARIDVSRASMTVPGLMQKMHNVNGTISMTNKDLRIDTLGGMLDEGAFGLRGTVTLENFKPVEVSVSVAASGLPIQVPDMFDMKIDADLRIRGDSAASLVEGEMNLLEGTYYKDVRLSPLQGVGRRTREQKPPPTERGPSFLGNMALNIDVKPRQDIVVDNNVAGLAIMPDLMITGTAARPNINGRATVESGTVTYYYRTFTVKKGVIDFVNPYRIEPVLDIESEVTIRDTTIMLTVSGTHEELVFSLSSDPEIEHDDILSLLLVGRTRRELERGDIVTSRSPEQLLAEMIGATVSEDIKKAAGLDILDVETGSEDSSNESDRIKVTVGKQLSRRLTTKYSIETEKGEPTQRAIMEYKIIENLLLQSYGDDKGEYGGEVQFKVEFR